MRSRSRDLALGLAARQARRHRNLRSVRPEHRAGSSSFVTPWASTVSCVSIDDELAVDLLSELIREPSDPQLQRAIVEVRKLPDGYNVDAFSGFMHFSKDPVFPLIAAILLLPLRVLLLGIKYVGASFRRIRGKTAHAERAARILSNANHSEAVAVAERIGDDPESTEDLRKAAASLRKAGLSPTKSSREITLIIITWLVLVGFPVAINDLPAGSQSTVVNEIATVGLALAITDHLKRRND